MQGTAIGTSDGVILVGGNDPSGLARGIGVDAGGGLQLSNYVETPEGLTLTATTGSLGSGTYYYRVSATTPAGETVPCAEKSIGVGASAGVILTWQQVPGATGYRVYGRSTGAELFIAAVTTGSVVTYTDAGTITPSGAMPTVNTALVNFGDVIATGQIAPGSAMSGNPVVMGASDGTNVRTVLSDTSGHIEVVGPGAVAAAVTGNPVMAGLSDGTNARYLLGDTSGRLMVIGGAAAGAAIAGNPVLMGGSDGTNARAALMDTSGRQIVIGAAVAGAAVTGNPVLIGGSDGTNARTIVTDTAGNINVTPGASVHATYVASVTAIAATTASQIIVIEAPTANRVFIRRIVIWNIGTDTSAGTVDFNLVRTTTAGTGGVITPAQMDTADAAFGGVVRSLPSPGGTLGTVIFHMTIDVNNTATTQAPYIIDFDGNRAGKPPIIPAGTANGIALYSPGATGAAAFAASIEFSL